jgi:hypothetical protein
MLVLRWGLGVVLAATASAYLALIMVAGDFRQSFGASAVNPLITVLPLVGMGLLLVPLVVPSYRRLLHTGAICAVALLGACVWFLIDEAATELWFAIFLLLGWLWFYARSVG